MIRLDVEKMIAAQRDTPLFDVRTPAEFEKGHIPGASNLPLFDDDERAVVGTLYKQEGRHPAILKGLDFVGPKMRRLVETVETIVGPPTEGDSPDVLVHCWRGGMRSGSVAWLLETYGWRVAVLEGGYKAYRRWALQMFERPFQWVTIGGRTGSAKTEVLHELRGLGEQVIDLEGLANHRGSAFGALGLPDQPSQQTFENQLARSLYDLDPRRRVWIEDESLMVGTCAVPQSIMNAKKIAPMFVLDVPIARRLDHLVEIYGDAELSGLRQSFINIERRLGNERISRAMDALDDNDVRTAAETALDYYDRAYDHGMSKRDPDLLRTLTIDADPGEIARQLLDAASDVVATNPAAEPI